MIVDHSLGLPITVSRLVVGRTFEGWLEGGPDLGRLAADQRDELAKLGPRSITRAIPAACWHRPLSIEERDLIVRFSFLTEERLLANRTPGRFVVLDGEIGGQSIAIHWYAEDAMTRRIDAVLNDAAVVVLDGPEQSIDLSATKACDEEPLVAGDGSRVRCVGADIHFSTTSARQHWPPDTVLATIDKSITLPLLAELRFSSEPIPSDDPPGANLTAIASAYTFRGIFQATDSDSIHSLCSRAIASLPWRKIAVTEYW